MALKCPKYLTGDSRHEFLRLQKEIQFQSSDLHQLVTYCEAVERYRLATEAVKREGLTITEKVFDRNGTHKADRIVRNPNLLTQREAATLMLRTAYLLGLTDLEDDEDAYAS
jgi:P27 family predicted phage terminase small subunit